MTRPTLTRAALADAALAVLADDRPLSMRTVADELKVSTMAAYRHVDGRDELGTLALARALELRAAALGAVGGRDDTLPELVAEAISAFSPYPGLAEELAHALEDEAPPHALDEWVAAVAAGYGTRAVRLAGWLVRGALSPRAGATPTALAAATAIHDAHERRQTGHTPLGVAKPTEVTP